MTPEISAVLDGSSRWHVAHGDCLDLAENLPRSAAVVSDPPYGMAWNPDSTRFTGGTNPETRRGAGRDDWQPIHGDDAPFDPAPWLSFSKVILFGANHYSQRLPVGTTLVWVKKAPHLYGTFLSDAEVAWQKGGYGVYCFEVPYANGRRATEGGGASSAPDTEADCAHGVVHPTPQPSGGVAGD